MTYNLPNDVDGVTYTNNLNTALNTISTAIPTIVAGTGISIIGDTISSTITQGLSTIYGGNDIVISGNDTISFINNTGYITESDTIFGNYPTKANNLSDVVSQQTALNNLTAVASATNEYVLTKDTSSGNAIFKAGGGDIHTTQTTVNAAAGDLNLSTASYTGKSFSPLSQDTLPFGIVVSADGSKMYVAGYINGAIYEYNLSTPGDVSTASYVNSFSTVSQLSHPWGLTISPDGTKMFVTGYVTNSIYQYNLGTAGDITTATYITSFDTSAQCSYVLGLTSSHDGHELYVVDHTTNFIYQYNLATAWTLSTASYSSKSLNPSSQDTSIWNLALSTDDTKIYVTGSATSSVYEYNLSVAGDISTAIYSTKFFNTTSQDTNCLAITFFDTKMYLMGYTSHTIYEYILTSASGGSAIFSEPFQASNYKNIIIYLNSLNGTASYTFPVAFTNTPQILSQSLTAKVTALSTIAVTITGTTDSGFIELIGY